MCCWHGRSAPIGNTIRDLVTEVEVTFTPLEGGTTRVDLEHRNLERFGDKVETVRAAIDSEGGWTGILKVYAQSAEAGA